MPNQQEHVAKLKKAPFTLSNETSNFKYYPSGSSNLQMDIDNFDLNDDFLCIIHQDPSKFPFSEEDSFDFEVHIAFNENDPIQTVEVLPNLSNQLVKIKCKMQNPSPPETPGIKKHLKHTFTEKSYDFDTIITVERSGVTKRKALTHKSNGSGLG